jgi:hypothetical protein
MTGDDSLDKRSDDHRTESDETVSQPQTEIPKPSVVLSVIEVLEGGIEVRICADVLPEGERDP